MKPGLTSRLLLFGRIGQLFLRVSTEKIVVVFMEKISVLLSLIESGPDVKVVVEITLIGGSPQQ